MQAKTQRLLKTIATKQLPQISQVRHFADSLETRIKSNIAREYGLGGDDDDDFLPERIKQKEEQADKQFTTLVMEKQKL